MPITSSAKRAIRVSARKRVYNVRRLEAMRGSVKTVRKAVSAGDAATAESTLSAAYKAIDKAAKRGVIKKNTAARKKSRLVAAIRKTVAKAPTTKKK